MKFSFSLESVNMLTSGPNFIYKQSKGFWVNYFKYIAAAGFKAVELPFNPFSSDPMAFETGRCGIPCNATAINSKYGSPSEFRAFLKDVGIDDISSIHVNANNAMLEVVAAKLPAQNYYTLFEDMVQQAIEHCKSLDCRALIISPSPELGWIKALLPEDVDSRFEETTVEILRRQCGRADKEGIQIAVTSEFWSLFRGEGILRLADKVPGLKLCPDPAHIRIAGLNEVDVLGSFGGNILCPRLTDTDFTDEYRNFERINAEIPVEGRQKVFSDLGDGNVDLLEFARTIKASGYNGYIVCEQRKTLDVYRGLLKLRWFLDHEIIKKMGDVNG